MKAKENPFRSECLHRLAYRLHDESWNDLITRLAKINYRAAVVGPCGSGKTTFLEELARQLAQRNVPTLLLLADTDDHRNRDHALQTAIRHTDQKSIILFDGADRLNWRQWRRLLRAANHIKGLVASFHSPRRLPTLHECKPSAALLETLVKELCHEHINSAELVALFSTHAGNIREVFRTLYDRQCLTSLTPNREVLMMPVCDSL